MELKKPLKGYSLRADTHQYAITQTSGFKSLSQSENEEDINISKVLKAIFSFGARRHRMCEFFNSCLMITQRGGRIEKSPKA